MNRKQKMEIAAVLFCASLAIFLAVAVLPRLGDSIFKQIALILIAGTIGLLGAWRLMKVFYPEKD